MLSSSFEEHHSLWWNHQIRLKRVTNFNIDPLSANLIQLISCRRCRVCMVALWARAVLKRWNFSCWSKHSNRLIDDDVNSVCVRVLFLSFPLCFIIRPTKCKNRRPIRNLVVLILAFWIPFIASLSTYKYTERKIRHTTCIHFEFGTKLCRHSSNDIESVKVFTVRLFTCFSACVCIFVHCLSQYSKHCKYILLMPFHSPFTFAVFRLYGCGRIHGLQYIPKVVGLCACQWTNKQQKTNNRWIKCSWDEK